MTDFAYNFMINVLGVMSLAILAIPETIQFNIGYILACVMSLGAATFYSWITGQIIKDFCDST